MICFQSGTLGTRMDIQLPSFLVVIRDVQAEITQGLLSLRNGQVNVFDRSSSDSTAGDTELSGNCQGTSRTTAFTTGCKLKVNNSGCSSLIK